VLFFEGLAHLVESGKGCWRGNTNGESAAAAPRKNFDERLASIDDDGGK
jgi:hypothetical protein